MTEEEQRIAKREYDRKAKRDQRIRDKAKAEAALTPKAHEYVMPEAQRKKLDALSAQIVTLVQTELAQELTPQDVYIVESISDVIVGIENGFTQAVHEPEGILIGGHFADASASEAIEHRHRFPQITESPTFEAMYRKFLNAVANWVRKNQTHVSPEYALEIRQELAGEYKLPESKIKPNPEPQPELQPPPVTIDSMGTKLVEQLNGDYSQFLTAHSEPKVPTVQ